MMDKLIGENSGSTNAVMNSSDANFMLDVAEVSKTIPVIVDFWAPWCGPCKQIGPALEKIANGSDGAVKLVKINIDENPQIAAKLKVQSIPAVFGFFNGQPVDAFTGAKPESQIKAFAEKLVATAGGNLGPSPMEQALEHAADLFEQEMFKEAGQVFGQAVSHDPGSAAAAGGLIKCFLKLNELDAAKNVIDQIEADVKAKPEMVSAIALYDLMSASDASKTDQQTLLDRIANDENDYQARLDYAVFAFSNGQQLEAMEALFYIIGRDIEWEDQAARKQLLKFFEALGPVDPLTLKGRRRLSSLLFS